LITFFVLSFRRLEASNEMAVAVVAALAKSFLSVV